MITRRSALGILAAGAPALHLAKAMSGSGPEIPAGPFQGTRESLKSYRIPEWYRDAKFGIWAHWGPQSHAEDGDWYARNLYMQGTAQNKYHVATYGHPSKFGHKDLCQSWTAENFDADHLIGLYKKAGAKYFCQHGRAPRQLRPVELEVPAQVELRGNGPEKGHRRTVQESHAKHGMQFAVSEHLAPSYHWFQTSHRADKTGSMAGVPYDGIDPKDSGSLSRDARCAAKRQRGRGCCGVR